MLKSTMKNIIKLIILSFIFPVVLVYQDITLDYLIGRQLIFIELI